MTPSLRLAVRALNSRNYRLFFAGQSVSLIGTWMTRIATSWLVYRLTGSALLLGLSGFVGQIPAFFLAFINHAKVLKELDYLIKHISFN